MTKNNLLPLLLSVLLAFGCNKPKQAKELHVLPAEIKTNFVDVFNVETKEEKLSKGLNVMLLSVDSSVYRQGLAGAQLTFKVELADECIKNLTTQKFDCYYYNLTYYTDEDCASPDLASIKKEKFVNLNTDPLVSSIGSRMVTIHIPYNSLNVPKGKNQVFLNFNIYCAKFKNDPSMHKVKVLDQLKSEPETCLTYKFRINTPDILKITVAIDGFALDSIKARAKRYDFGITGSGFPDLFWKVDNGAKVIYSSPIKKNCFTFRQSLQTPTFTACESDSIKITFADSDNEQVLNKHDVISVWKGPVSLALNKFAQPTDPQIPLISKCKIKLTKL